MNDTALEAILRRDRIIVAAALVVIAILAWVYLAYLGVQMDMPAAPLPSDATGEMPGMDMPGMDLSMPGKDMGTAMAPGFGAWTPANFAFVFVNACGCDDGGDDDTICNTHGVVVCPGWPQGADRWKALCSYRMVLRRLFAGLDFLQHPGDYVPVDFQPPSRC